jgi:hypothetical protein
MNYNGVNICSEDFCTVLNLNEPLLIIILHLFLPFRKLHNRDFTPGINYLFLEFCCFLSQLPMEGSSFWMVLFSSLNVMSALTRR